MLTNNPIYNCIKKNFKNNKIPMNQLNQGGEYLHIENYVTSAIFWKSLNKIGVSSSLNFW